MSCLGRGGNDSEEHRDSISYLLLMYRSNFDEARMRARTRGCVSALWRYAHNVVHSDLAPAFLMNPTLYGCPLDSLHRRYKETANVYVNHSSDMWQFQCSDEPIL